MRACIREHRRLTTEEKIYSGNPEYIATCPGGEALSLSKGIVGKVNRSLQ